MCFVFSGSHHTSSSFLFSLWLLWHKHVDWDCDIHPVITGKCQGNSTNLALDVLQLLSWGQQTPTLRFFFWGAKKVKLYICLSLCLSFLQWHQIQIRILYFTGCLCSWWWNGCCRSRITCWHNVSRKGERMCSCASLLVRKISHKSLPVKSLPGGTEQYLVTRRYIKCLLPKGTRPRWLGWSHHNSFLEPEIGSPFLSSRPCRGWMQQ